MVDTPPNFKTRFISEELTRLLGYLPQEFYDSDTIWMDSVHEDDLQRITLIFNEFRISEQDTLESEHNQGSIFSFTLPLV